MITNKLKTRLSEGDTVYGPFCKIQDPAVVEIAALAGFDFVIIDMEHGPYNIEFTQNMLRAAETRGITPVVRITENSESLILRTLDIGAAGIQVPHISARKDAEKVVKAAAFYPLGERGMCRYVRAAGYTAAEKEEYFTTANDQIITIIHIEGTEGLENLQDILEVDGIDVIFLGPYDLSQSCGVPGEVYHEKVVRSMEEAVRLVRKHGKAVGTFTESVADAQKWSRIGIQYISYAVDVGILMDAFREISSTLKQQST